MAAKKSSVDRLAALRAKLATTDMGGGGGGGFWSPKVGRNTIRILPEVGEMEFFFQTVGRHNLGEGQNAKQIYCPNFTSEGDLACPICETRSMLYKQNKQGDKSAGELAKQLGVRRSYWMNVIDRSNEDAGPLVFTPGVTIMNALAALVSDPEYGDITDIYEGVDIKIERTGTGLDTEYQVIANRKDSPLHESDEQIDQWLDSAKDLSYAEVSTDPSEDAELAAGHALFVLPYERVKAEFDDFLGFAGDAEEDDEPEPEPRKAAVAPVRARRARKVEPEPEEEEVVYDEDEEPEDVDEPEVEDDEPDEVKAELEKRKAVRRTRRR